MYLCTLSWRVATLFGEVDVFSAGTGVDFPKTLFFKWEHPTNAEDLSLLAHHPCESKEAARQRLLRTKRQFTQMGGLGHKPWCREKGKRGVGSVSQFLHSFTPALFPSANIHCCSFSTRFSAGCRGNGSIKQPLPSRNTDVEAKTGSRSLSINSTNIYWVPNTGETARKKSNKVSSSWSLQASGGGHRY